MKILSFLTMFMLIANFVFAETYTGKPENIRANDRGVEFTVVITDSSNKEVLRRDQWVSTGVMTGIQAKDAIKNVVERMTQEIYAHLEGVKEVIADKVNLEKYTSSCNAYIAPELRKNPQDAR